MQKLTNENDLKVKYLYTCNIHDIITFHGKVIVDKSNYVYTQKNPNGAALNDFNFLISDKEIKLNLKR